MTVQTGLQGKSRVDWVDYGKGICIILVVMMHSTLGVEKALGETNWLHTFIEWAAPFRMPDFFLISGLFLASRINRPWRSYLDTKVVHFGYFYILWLTIQFALKSKGLVAEMGAGGTIQLYFMSFIEPLGTLWFIHILAIFFAVAKLVHRLPVAAVWLCAAALEMAPIHTGWMVIDEFAARFVYFYSGYVLAPHVFDFAQRMHKASNISLFCGLYIWAVINGWMVFNGYSTLPLVGLGLGFIGVAAVVTVSVILARGHLLSAVRYCGENSIVIYLAFFVFMAATRMILLKTGIVGDAGLISLATTAAGVAGPVIMYWMVRRTPAKFLFERPAMFRLKPGAATKTEQIIAAE